MASFKVSGFRVLRRLIEHKTIERLSAGIPSQIGKSGWGFTSTRLGGLAWGLVKIDNISRFGNINQPYKRVFIGRIKSVINYLPRCSYLFTLQPITLRYEKICWIDPSWLYYF